MSRDHLLALGLALLLFLVLLLLASRLGLV
jgi:hypothetical protein